MNRKIFIFIFLFFLGAFVFAQGENLTIKIAVVGPGDPLYFWWGHIALIIDDSAAGRSYFYDYGIFSFDNENFFTNFALGRLYYSCGVSSTERNYDVYRKTNRSIVIYTLDLPPETRAKVRDFAQINILPENRDYFYHHFKDNCSTRIRDIIDFAADGQFKRQYENQTGGFTLRDHVRRYTWFSPTVDWLLNFWMGQVIDNPVTIWEDMFLPAEVGRRIDEFYYTDVNGQRRKLVSSVETVLKAVNRPGILEKPLLQWPRELAFSIALSAIFSFFFFLYARKINAGRILAGVSVSLCGFIFGVAGLFLYFLTFISNHDYTYQNINILFGTPLLLALIPFGIGYAFTKNPQKLLKYDALSRLVWLLAAAGIFISMALKLLPAFYQDNLTDQMLLLPIALVFAFQPVGLKQVIDRYIKRNKEHKWA
ncbi:MAG: DUF4105 domain-containing protein [Treponema sp.]|nr:DUF4105 domain-containing protein [Treponema sp.]